jgi:hypothetical protein
VLESIHPRFVQTVIKCIPEVNMHHSLRAKNGTFVDELDESVNVSRQGDGITSVASWANWSECRQAGFKTGGIFGGFAVLNTTC